MAATSTCLVMNTYGNAIAIMLTCRKYIYVCARFRPTICLDHFARNDSLQSLESKHYIHHSVSTVWEIKSDSPVLLFFSWLVLKCQVRPPHKPPNDDDCVCSWWTTSLHQKAQFHSWGLLYECRVTPQATPLKNVLLRHYLATVICSSICLQHRTLLHFAPVTQITAPCFQVYQRVWLHTPPILESLSLQTFFLCNENVDSVRHMIQLQSTRGNTGLCDFFPALHISTAAYSWRAVP